MTAQTPSSLRKVIYFAIGVLTVLIFISKQLRHEQNTPAAQAPISVANNTTNKHTIAYTVAHVDSDNQHTGKRYSGGKDSHIWITDDLQQYASLIQEDVNSLWRDMEKNITRPNSEHRTDFTSQQSEFYQAISMLPLNVSTVCEIGPATGRSTISWLESAPWVHVWSFARNLTTDAATLKERNFLESRYNQGIVPRVHWITYQEQYTSEELGTLRLVHSIPYCDVVVIYGSTLPDEWDTTTLKLEFEGAAALVQGWHFVVVDGIDCTRDTTVHTDSLALDIPADGVNLVNHKSLLTVQQVWSGAVHDDLIVAYECWSSSTQDANPGWYLGTYRKQNSNALDIQGENRPESWSVLTSTNYLAVGERLESNNKDYFLNMQSDGNLVIYRVNDPRAPGQDTAIWSSRTSGREKDYFLAIRADSNLAVYPGTEGTVEGPAIWSTKSRAVEGLFYLVMQDDGKLAIYRGAGPEDSQGLLRRMRPRYSRPSSK